MDKYIYVQNREARHRHMDMWESAYDGGSVAKQWGRMGYSICGSGIVTILRGGIGARSHTTYINKFEVHYRQIQHRILRQNIEECFYELRVEQWYIKPKAP